MHIGIAFGVFIVPYIIQLLLCFKAKNKHMRLIPFYICMLAAMYSGMVYTEFFGLYDDGSWSNKWKINLSERRILWKTVQVATAVSLKVMKVVS